MFLQIWSSLLSELLIQRLLEVSPGYMPFAPSNQTLIKWREAYWCYFSVLDFSLPPLPGKFSADALVSSILFISFSSCGWARHLSFSTKLSFDYDLLDRGLLNIEDIFKREFICLKRVIFYHICLNVLLKFAKR